MTAGYNAAAPFYGQGRQALTHNYAAGLAPYTDIYTAGTRGAGAYGDATGANGPEGYARATTNFRTDPGYQFELGQGLQAIDRGAASRGLLSSGNTAMAEQQYGTGLADQSYSNYVNRLLPYLQQQDVAASGINANRTGLGGAINSSYGNQGNLAFNTQAGIGQARSAADVAQANADNSFLQGIANLGGKLLGASGNSFGGGSGGGSGVNPTSLPSLGFGTPFLSGGFGVS